LSEVVDLFSIRYAGPVLLGVLLVLFFPAGKNIADPAERRKYRLLQAFTLLGAVVGAKVSVLMGDLRWPLEALPSKGVLIDSGRSITGGLIGGLLTAEALKPLMGYRLPPNDRFAVVLPFSIAIGRSGCWMSGCCLGLPTEGPLGVLGIDGVARYPAVLYEIAFQVSAGLLLVLLLRRGRLFGHLFALYLVLYGIFRFGTEFIRETPTYLVGLSAYQFLALGMIVLGLVFAGSRWRSMLALRGGAHV